METYRLFLNPSKIFSHFKRSGYHLIFVRNLVLKNESKKNGLSQYMISKQIIDKNFLQVQKLFINCF